MRCPGGATTRPNFVLPTQPAASSPQTCRTRGPDASTPPLCNRRAYKLPGAPATGPHTETFRYPILHTRPDAGQLKWGTPHTHAPIAQLGHSSTNAKACRRRATCRTCRRQAQHAPAALPATEPSSSDPEEGRQSGAARRSGQAKMCCSGAALQAPACTRLPVMHGKPTSVSRHC